MLSALMMLQRVGRATRHAFREEEFGILVEILRRLGMSFVAVNTEEHAAKERADARVGRVGLEPTTYGL